MGGAAVGWVGCAVVAVGEKRNGGASDGERNGRSHRTRFGDSGSVITAAGRCERRPRSFGGRERGYDDNETRLPLGGEQLLSRVADGSRVGVSRARSRRRSSIDRRRLPNVLKTVRGFRSGYFNRCAKRPNRNANKINITYEPVGATPDTNRVAI